MELMENIKRFGKILESSVSNERGTLVTEVARSLIMADIAHIGDPDRGKYEHLSLCGLAMCHIPEFRGVDKSHGDSGEEALSDVMQMRIMCDTLTLLLNGDQPYAMRYTADVAKAMGQRVRTGVGRYLEYDECEKILDSYYDSVPTFDESLRPIFERISFYLCELWRLQPTINSSATVIKPDCLSDIWLPSGFDHAGFTVQTKEPKCLRELNVGNKAVYVEEYDLSLIMSILIRVIVRVKTGDIAQDIFFSRIGEIRTLSPQCFPVGTGLGSSIPAQIYYPHHFITNQALRCLYEECFTDRQRLTRSGVDATLQALKAWYEVE